MTGIRTSPTRTGNRTRCLFIVARNQPDLWQHLKRDFADEDQIQVIVDRRRGERRQRREPHGPERRRSDRRRATIDRDLRYRSFVIVHEQQGVLAAPFPSR